jgi:REP element-mobilizing transposase RayT
VFVTICTHNRQHLFGTVLEGEMHRSPAGQYVHNTWLAIPQRFPAIACDALVVMPEHLHAILFAGQGEATEATRATVGDVVRSFKSTVLAAWRKGIETEGWPPYDGRLWQPYFHDRIVRNDRHLEQARAYIEGNPGRWQEKST